MCEQLDVAALEVLEVRLAPDQRDTASARQGRRERKRILSRRLPEELDGRFAVHGYKTCVLGGVGVAVATGAVNRTCPGRVRLQWQRASEMAVLPGSSWSPIGSPMSSATRTPVGMSPVSLVVARG